jgi:hypothetical protein
MTIVPTRLTINPRLQPGVTQAKMILGFSPERALIHKTHYRSVLLSAKSCINPWLQPGDHHAESTPGFSPERALLHKRLYSPVSPTPRSHALTPGFSLGITGAESSRALALNELIHKRFHSQVTELSAKSCINPWLQPGVTDADLSRGFSPETPPA